MPTIRCYPKGKCCSIGFCSNPSHELRPEHKCPGCAGTVYILCATFDEETDKYWYKQCIQSLQSNKKKSYNKFSQDKSSKSKPKYSKAYSGTAKESRNIDRKCSTCGGTDHLHRMSRPCPLNKVTASGKKLPAEEEKEECPENSEIDEQDEAVKTTSTYISNTKLRLPTNL
eukprot:10435581-Ditylum_brightwellii.AAC.2